MVFSTSPFHCGYSVDDVLLKSYAAAYCMYSIDEKQEPLSENTSATPNRLKRCCVALATPSLV